MNKLFFYSIAFCLAALFLPGSKAAYFPQPMINMGPSSPLGQRVNAIMAKWQLLASQFNSTPNQITGSEQEIKEDQAVLNQALSTPGPGDRNQMSQILFLIDLAQLRLLIRQTKEAEQSFPSSFEANNKSVAKQTSFPRRQGLHSPDWYRTNGALIGRLMTKFGQFLSQNPTYYTAPPLLLVGLGSTYDEGKRALDKYNQYISCFSNPQIPLCTTLSIAAGNPQQSSNQNDDNSDDDNDDDDNG